MKFAEQRGGLFPATAADAAFRDYYCTQVGSKLGEAPVNPFTEKTEWPVNGKIKSIQDAKLQSNAEIPAGAIEYTAILNQNGIPVSFCLRAGDENGLALKSDSGEIIVHSND